LIEIVKTYAPKFDIEDMDLSYVLPIFIWVTEILLFSWEIPVKVSINEAVEISKVYWDDSSRKMVNWVLNRVISDLDELNKKLSNFKNSDTWFSLFKK
jgi:N utilization substance protein B